MMLTTAEFETQRDTLLRKFAATQTDRMNHKVWRVATSTTALSERKLWLFVYAINTLENEDGAENQNTEKDVMLIFQKANTL